MTTTNGKSAGDLSEEREATERSADESWEIDQDCEVMDYMALPGFGEMHFSLLDISLLAALDEWWRQHGTDDPVFGELIADQKARQAAAPLQRSILAALLRSVEMKELEARVFARDLATSSPIPARTYAHIWDLDKCLEKYALGHGHLVGFAREELDGEEGYEVAAAVARRRAAIRMGINYEARGANEPDVASPDEVIVALRNEVRGLRIQVAHLERSLHGRGVEGRPLGRREAGNLHRAVGALLSLVLPHYGKKQEAVIADIEEKFKNKEGVSKRQLEKLFPIAKKALDD